MNCLSFRNRFIELSAFSTYQINAVFSKFAERCCTIFVQKIEEIGESIYIRDVSFLGFPSYYIYVTGMSEVVNTFNCNEQTIDNLSNNQKLIRIIQVSY